MGRHRALSDDDERQLARLVDAGVRQELAGAVLGVSRRTVVRTLARRRAARREQTVQELLAEFRDDNFAAQLEATTSDLERWAPRP
jgi:predicted DNA-binding protein (UPF0251 family)